MKKITPRKLTIFAITLLVLGIFSCSKDEVNLNDLNEIIYVRHKNADMPAYIHGNGSDKVFLIILHGGPGGNGLSYRQNTISTEIEKNNAVVYFDQRGSGNSQGSYSEEGINLDIMAEDVLALAKVIKDKYGDDSKLFLMGHSWGGTLGPAALLKNQENFSGWINVDGSHNPKGLYGQYKVVLKEIADEQIALGNSIDHWQSVLDKVQNVGQDFSVDDFFTLNKAAIRGEYQLEMDKVINEGKTDRDDDVAGHNPTIFTFNSIGLTVLFANKKELYEKVSFTDRLSEITIPSLVLWGKYDLTVPTVLAQEAYDNLGSIDKEIFIFEKSAHSPMNNEPELFADKVIEFINQHK